MTKPRTKKANRRGHGEGSISKLADGTFRWQIELPRDAVTGKRIRRAGRARTYDEAKDRRDEALRLVREGKPQPDKRQSVESWLTYWLDEVLAFRDVRESSRYQYRCQIRANVVPHLGHKVIGTLTVQDIQRWSNTLTRQGLSPATRRQAMIVLRSALTDAVKHGKMSTNPALLVNLPSKGTPERDDWLTFDQGLQLVRATEGHRLGAFVTVALTTGMRRGEVLAMKWTDVDLEARRLTVSGTTKRLVGVRAGVEGAGLIIDHPKSAKSRRTFSIPPITVAALRKHRARQLEEKLAAGERWTDNDLVFCTETGGLVDPRDMTDQFHTWATAAGLGKAKIHALRHSAAAALIAQGVGIFELSRQLGHSDIGITANTYGHLLPQVEDATADAAERAWSGLGS